MAGLATRIGSFVMKLTKQTNGPQTGHPLVLTRNSSGDEIANVNFFYYDIFNHFYAVRSGSYRIR